MRHWRGMAAMLRKAGFDVPVADRRGNGIFGGKHGYDTAEQANDIVRELEQLKAGEGLRILTPDGQTPAGEEASVAPGRDRVPDMPMVLGGCWHDVGCCHPSGLLTRTR